MEVVPFTARRIRPGAYAAFREAWEPEDGLPPFVRRIFHARNRRDENEIISFGMVEGSDEELARMRDELHSPAMREREERRSERMAPHVEAVLLDGIFVVDRVLAGGGEDDGAPLALPLSARRLRPGAYDAWLEAFVGPAERVPTEAYRAIERVTVMRHVDDPELVVSFGLGSRAAWDALFERHGDQIGAQREAMAPHVDEMVLDAVYDAIEVIQPAAART
jgi:hypothetical protein